VDFREAESRFLQLQENYQNQAISEESFFQSVSKLMVQDSRGVYWTIDPRTGNWLVYDGHVWQRSVPPTKEITDKITRASKPLRTGSWAVGLSVGGLAVFAVLFVAALVAYRAFVLGHSPKVQVRWPKNGAQVAVGEAMAIETISSNPKGISRVELWVDDQLVLPETNPPSGPSVSLTFPWVFADAGSHTVRVKAYSASGTIGESSPVIVEVAPSGNTVLPTLVVLEGAVDIGAGEESPWQAVEGNPYLQVGQSVRTHEGGRVQLVFADDAVAELGENTQASLREAAISPISHGGDFKRIALFLSYGDSWHRLGMRGERLLYEVETASARVVLEGALAHVMSSPAEETWVEAVEGDAVVIGAGKSLRLNPGQKAHVAPGKTPALFSSTPLPTLRLKSTSPMSPGD